MKIRNLIPALAIIWVSGAQAGLLNGGFETPTLLTGTYTQTNQVNVPGWQTTATDSLIEIWRQPFNNVPAFEGSQFAELNATQPSTLFQDAANIKAGSTVGWQFAHRGRSGVDTMRFTLTDLGGDGVFGSSDDTVLFNNTFSDGTAAWGFYAGTGITALGNTVRFAFTAESAAGGPSIGNFLDAADFGVGVGVSNVPEPGTVALAGLALAAMGLASRRRRAA